MIRRILILIFLLNSSFLFGQGVLPDTVIYWSECQCDKYQQLDTTCIDKNGLKQGYWKFYRKLVYIFDNYGDGVIDTIVQDDPLHEGLFYNDMKIGEWKNCFLHGLEYSWEQIIWYTESDLFHPSGKFITKSNFSEYEINFNQDTTEFVAEYLGLRNKTENRVFLESETLGDTIFFTLKVNDTVLSKFPLSEFQTEYDKFIYGEYDRKIINYTR